LSLFFAFFGSVVPEPFVVALVDPLAVLVPLASVDWVALPEADWSPVVFVAVWPDVCAPVVVVAEVLADWSPVLVALSIDRLERPRRSMVGLNVDVEPVMEVFWSVVEPVIDEPCVLEEPVSDGLAVALPDAFTPVVADGLDVADAALSGAEAPRAPALALVPLLAEDVASGTQSMCTGLDERSFAMPVLLSACLPALGWPRVLHRGLDSEACGVAVVALVCANAVPIAPITAAASRLRVRWMRFMWCLLQMMTRTKTGVAPPSCHWDG
jgi:hypothetical protein